MGHARIADDKVNELQTEFELKNAALASKLKDEYNLQLKGEISALRTSLDKEYEEILLRKEEIIASKYREKEIEAQKVFNAQLSQELGALREESEIKLNKEIEAMENLHRASLQEKLQSMQADHVKEVELLQNDFISERTNDNMKHNTYVEKLLDRVSFLETELEEIKETKMAMAELLDEYDTTIGFLSQKAVDADSHDLSYLDLSELRSEDKSSENQPSDDGLSSKTDDEHISKTDGEW